MVEKRLNYAGASNKYALNYMIYDKKERSVGLKKKSMQNRLSGAKEKVMESDRKCLMNTKKQKKDSISFYGLRYNLLRVRFMPFCRLLELLYR